MRGFGLCWLEEWCTGVLIFVVSPKIAQKVDQSLVICRLYEYEPEDACEDVANRGSCDPAVVLTFRGVLVRSCDCIQHPGVLGKEGTPNYC